MALHIFVVRDLMADWGWGFTCPQPLPNPLLSRAKCNFQLAIQKKETEVSPRLTNFVLLYVLSINLAAKVANFRLTAKKDSEKSYRLDSGVQSINTQPRNKAQLDRKGQLPVVQGPRYGNGTQEKVYFQPSNGSGYRLGSP